MQLTDHHTTYLTRDTWYQRARLDDKFMNYLWQQIDNAKKDNDSANHYLAGNISKSLGLKDPDNHLINTALRSLHEQNKDSINNEISQSLRSYNQNGIPTRPEMLRLWVNFQKKHEFNPIHNHSGVLSFVIWMDIPYTWADEKELDFVKHSNTIEDVGNFVFCYATGRRILTETVRMKPDISGYMLLFPSWLDHIVYPFYTSDKERISISGNIVFTPCLELH